MCYNKNRKKKNRKEGGEMEKLLNNVYEVVNEANEYLSLVRTHIQATNRYIDKSLQVNPILKLIVQLENEIWQYPQYVEDDIIINRFYVEYEEETNDEDDDNVGKLIFVDMFNSNSNNISFSDIILAYVYDNDNIKNKIQSLYDQETIEKLCQYLQIEKRKHKLQQIYQLKEQISQIKHEANQLKQDADKLKPDITKFPALYYLFLNQHEIPFFREFAWKQGYSYGNLKEYDFVRVLLDYIHTIEQ